MKKLIAIIALLLSAPHAEAAVYYSGYAPYNCTSTVTGFYLEPVPGGYDFMGEVYVPRPGYQAVMSDVSFNPARPNDAQATLTLIPPANIMNSYALKPLTEVPPVPVNYTFTSRVPIHRLTVAIANPVNRFDTQVTCLPTGVSE